jgi:protein SCO1/2
MIAAAILGALSALASPAAPAAQAPAQVLERVGFDQNLGARLPLDARFVDDGGTPVALGEVLGERPAVLAFVYYECPMLCTLVLNGLVRALRAIDLAPGEDFDVVAISIDPAETPELARAKKAHYLEAYGRPDAARGWRFLCGGEEEIRRVAAAAGFRYEYVAERDEFAHASGLVVLTPEGEVARYLYGVEYAPRDLRLGLVEASAGRIGSPVDKVLLLCMHYDPLTGRYGFAIVGAIRLFGGLTVAALAAFIARSLARELRRRASAQGAGG